MRKNSAALRTEVEELVLDAPPRVQIDENAMINTKADIDQLAPFTTNWAWQNYLPAEADPLPQAVKQGLRRPTL